MNEDEIRKTVRETYAKIAVGDRAPESTEAPETASCRGPQEASASSCCGPQPATNAASCAPAQAADAASCCGPQTTDAAGCGSNRAEETAMGIGYSAGELGALPEGANMGLGCGNPTALATLTEGEVVLDLGSGGGIDCFLAASAVGKGGSVIGVDMTPEMISKARGNAQKGGYENVDFRLGEIENLPVADETVDAVISNCVINLSTNKARVFEESYRALRPGGRVMVWDIVLRQDLPEHIKNSVAAYAGCVAGAQEKEEYLATVRRAGFEAVEIVSEVVMGSGELEGAISSVNVRATKPR